MRSCICTLLVALVSSVASQTLLDPSLQYTEDVQLYPSNAYHTFVTPEESALDKRRYNYEFGLGKRHNGYAFGLGKRNSMYGFGLGKRGTDNEDSEDDQAYIKRDRNFGFGLGKRSSGNSFGFGLGKRESAFSYGLGKRDSMFRYGLGKRSNPINDDTYLDNETQEVSDDTEHESHKRGKREVQIEEQERDPRSYSFGLGKRGNSHYSFGLGKRPDNNRGPKSYSFGLGKRDYDNFDDIPNIDEYYTQELNKELEKRYNQYAFGLGKRSSQTSPEDQSSFFNFGKRPASAMNFGLGKRSMNAKVPNLESDPDMKYINEYIKRALANQRQREMANYRFGLGK